MDLVNRKGKIEEQIKDISQCLSGMKVPNLEIDDWIFVLIIEILLVTSSMVSFRL